MASLVGVIVTTVHTLRVDFDFTAGEILIMVVMPFVVAALLVWFSKHAEGRGWIS